MGGVAILQGPHAASSARYACKVLVWIRGTYRKHIVSDASRKRVLALLDCNVVRMNLRGVTGHEHDETLCPSRTTNTVELLHFRCTPAFKSP